MQVYLGMKLWILFVIYMLVPLTVKNVSDEILVLTWLIDLTIFGS